MKTVISRVMAARAWGSLEAELRRWARAGRKPKFWWRDDDARGRTEPLQRLVDIASEHATPLLLAVVPDDQAESLRPLLLPGIVSAAQHGVDHQDRSGGEGPRSEFHNLAGAGDVARQLTRGRRKLGDLTSASLYVPPWNTLFPNTIDALEEAGFKFVSAFGGPMEKSGGLSRLDAHLDLMRWSPTPRFRGEARLLTLTRRHLARLRRARAWDEPTGLLTHHLAHDEAAWSFLPRFIARLKAAERVEWLSADVLLGCAPA